MRYPDQHLDAVILRTTIGRAIGIGAGLGALAGTAVLPGVGTIVGMIVGAGVGLILGLVNAPALMLVGQGRRWWWASATSATVSGATAYVIALGLDLEIRAVFAALCVVVAAIAAPHVLASSAARVARAVPCPSGRRAGTSARTPS